MPVSKETQNAAIRSALKTICYNLGVQQVRPTPNDSEALIHVLGPDIGETPHARPAGEQVQNAIHCLTLAIMREGPFASTMPSHEGEQPAASAAKAEEPAKGKKGGKQTEETVPRADDAAEAKPADAGGQGAGADVSGKP